MDSSNPHIFPSRQRIDELRALYPAQTLIELQRMDDPYAPIEPGTRGRVSHVDDSGNIHMAWDNGRTLSLIDGIDDFRIVVDDPASQAG